MKQSKESKGMLKLCIDRLLVSCLALSAANVAWAQSLKVDESGHFLVYEDNDPFFYLGDTAWELFHRLDRDDADAYLSDRAEKGFTVIQAVVVAAEKGLEEPNAYGDFVFHDSDPLQPNEAYFQHVDYIVDKSEKLGLFIGMLPTWGIYWSSMSPNERIFSPESAMAFGKYIGARYKDKPVIWILGGDQDIYNSNDRRIIEAMARGLKDGDGGKHLITYHPRGPGFSSDYFHNADWLDFNMYQSSHGAHDHDNGLFAEHDLSLIHI